MTNDPHTKRHLNREVIFENVLHNLVWDGEIESPDTLHYFARLPSDKIRFAVLINRYTREDTIEYLLADPYFIVDIAKALSYGLSKECLTNICKDGCLDARKQLADNETTPVEYLRILAQDEDSAIRMYVALNPNITITIANYLRYDDDFLVRAYAARRLENFRNSEA